MDVVDVVPTEVEEVVDVVVDVEVLVVVELPTEPNTCAWICERSWSVGFRAPVVGSVPHCIRVMLHVTTERSKGEIHHVYLEGARGLRDDLPD